jgi:hypothetical protein
MKNNYLIYSIIFIICFTILIIVMYNMNKNIKNEPFDFFTCTMNIDNIDPKFKDNYLKYDNQHVSCGPCKDATLKININTCPVDEYGSTLPNCQQKGSITSSFGNPIIFTYDVTPENMSKFFCID